MSFPESQISDLLDKSTAEELYNNVPELIEFVENQNLHQNQQELQDNMLNLNTEQPVDLKPELFNPQFPEELPLQLPPVFNAPSIVCNEDYAGPYEFDVSIIPNNGSKNPWVYSSILSKVFIDMNSQFPIDFRINTRPPDLLYVRVMPAFSSLQHAQDFVYRCMQHEQFLLNKNIPDHVRYHIIRCSNSNAYYLGDKLMNERLSILFPLGHPQPGADAVREMFSFVCKTSCPTGMNRRPIEIIFTLENTEAKILGRRVLNVRICSCPKRDKDKEERDAMNGEVSRGKRRKIEKPQNSTTNDNKDTTLYPLNIDVPGKQNLQFILEIARDRMTSLMVRNPQNNDNFVTCYKNIQEKLNQLKQE